MFHKVELSAKVINALLTSTNGIFPRIATKFWDEGMVIRATRRTYEGKIRWRNGAPVEILLHIGKPNYAEREFIKKCKKTGEPFPVKKIQLGFLKVAK